MKSSRKFDTQAIAPATNWMYSTLIWRGYQPHDADDICQGTLAEMLDSLALNGHNIQQFFSRLVKRKLTRKEFKALFKQLRKVVARVRREKERALTKHVENGQLGVEAYGQSIAIEDTLRARELYFLAVEEMANRYGEDSEEVLICEYIFAFGEDGEVDPLETFDVSQDEWKKKSKAVWNEVLSVMRDVRRANPSKPR